MIEIQADKEGTVVIRGEATIHFIKEFHETLLAGLGTAENRSEQTLMLDLKELTSMDTAGAQALLAFIRSYKAKEVKIDFTSEAIRPFLEMAGLKRYLLEGGA